VSSLRSSPEEVSESPITLAWRKDRQDAIDIGLASLDEEEVAA
jgi:hypothetical protein